MTSLTPENIVFAVIVVPMVVLIFMANRYYARADKLFERLEKIAPEYYKQIGRPLVASFNIWRAQKGRLFLHGFVIWGIPKDFPGSKDARKMADELSWLSLRSNLVLLAVFLLIAGSAVVSNFF